MRQRPSFTPPAAAASQAGWKSLLSLWIISEVKLLNHFETQQGAALTTNVINLLNTREHELSYKLLCRGNKLVLRLNVLQQRVVGAEAEGVCSGWISNFVSWSCHVGLMRQRLFQRFKNFTRYEWFVLLRSETRSHFFYLMKWTPGARPCFPAVSCQQRAMLWGILVWQRKSTRANPVSLWVWS